MNEIINNEEGNVIKNSSLENNDMVIDYESNIDKVLKDEDSEIQLLGKKKLAQENEDVID